MIYKCLLNCSTEMTGYSVSSEGSKLTTTLYICASTVGLGYLGLSYSCHKSSIVITFALIILAVYINYYSSLLILKANKLNPRCDSYGELVAAVIGPKWGAFANFISIWYRISVAIFYLHTASELVWTGFYQLFNIQKGELIVQTITHFVLIAMVFAMLCRGKLERVKRITVVALLCLLVFVVAITMQVSERQALQPPGSKLNIISWPSWNNFIVFVSSLYAFVHQATLVFILQLFENEDAFEEKRSVC